MQYQIDTNEDGTPVNLTLELTNGNLLVKDENNSVIVKTIGNPETSCSPNNLGFASIDEAYDWFITTKYATRLDTN